MRIALSRIGLTTAILRRAARALLAAACVVMLPAAHAWELPADRATLDAATVRQIVDSAAYPAITGYRRDVAYIDCVRHRPAAIVTQFPGENPLVATMVHDLYLAQSLLASREPARFSSQFHRTPRGEVDVALAQLQWENGPLASFAASYLTPEGMASRGFDRMPGESVLAASPGRLKEWEPAAPRGRDTSATPPAGRPPPCQGRSAGKA